LPALIGKGADRAMTPTDGHPLILFDGVCNLCESSVRFVIKRDADATFRFAPLQSDVARDLLQAFDYDHDSLSSMLLIDDGELYRRSRAALKIAKRLDGAWPLFYYLFFWVPRFLADPVYDFIGKRRYRWFGMKEECWIPDENLRRRFVDEPPSNA
jgi:predicted DCC family thiol-disulfide oxidoreductase YuxK